MLPCVLGMFTVNTQGSPNLSVITFVPGTDTCMSTCKYLEP